MDEATPATNTRETTGVCVHRLCQRYTAKDNASGREMHLHAATLRHQARNLRHAFIWTWQYTISTPNIRLYTAAARALFRSGMYTHLQPFHVIQHVEDHQDRTHIKAALTGFYSTPAPLQPMPCHSCLVWANWFDSSILLSLGPGWWCVS